MKKSKVDKGIKLENNHSHSAMAKILASKKDPQIFNSIKNTYDFKILCNVSENILKTNALETFRHPIFGSPKPEKLEELGNANDPFKPKFIQNEIKWMLLSIRQYSRNLALFVLLKADFEQYFLKGEYLKAEELLETINKDLGTSVWYLESKFLIYEYTNRSAEQKKLLSELNKINKNGIVASLAYFLAQRTERNLSAYKYDSDLNNLFYRKNTDADIDTHQYYLFRLNYYEHYKQSDLAPFLAFEAYNSVIDRYLLLVDVLKSLSLNPTNKGLVFNSATYLHRKTNDKALVSLLTECDLSSLPAEYYNVELIKILDLYYSGFYKETIEECRRYIAKHTILFDLLVIYARAHINLKRGFELFDGEKNCLLNQIGSKVFQLLNCQGDSKSLIYNLYQINKNIYSFSLSPDLNYFIKDEKNIRSGKELKYLNRRGYRISEKKGATVITCRRMNCRIILRAYIIRMTCL